MAVKHYFAGKVIEEPGVYSQQTSGVKNPPLNLDYGTVLLIDTNGNLGTVGGNSINGTNVKGKSAIAMFEDAEELKGHLMGSDWCHMADALFNPSDFGVKGASKVYFISAREANPASAVLQMERMSVAITAAGTGYAVGNRFTINTGTQLSTYQVSTIGAGGSVTGITLVSRGLGYTNGVKTTTNVTGVGTGLTVTISNVATILSMDIQTKMEGVKGNGIINNNTTLLIEGFALQFKVGPTSTPSNPKYIIEFTAGTYAGVDSNGAPYFGESVDESKPIVILQSDEFSTTEELKFYVENNAKFKNLFNLKTGYSFSPTSIALDNIDLSSYSSLKLFSGGTQTYNQSDFDDLLDIIPELEYNFVITDNHSINAMDNKNILLLGHLLNEAKFDKFMYIGGGENEDNFESGTDGSSIDTAEFYNSKRVIIVHAGFYKKGLNQAEFYYSSAVKTAAVVGILAGLPPQVPATFKKIKFNRDGHDLTVKQRKLALRKGVLHTKYDSELGGFVINQAINSLQKNDFMVNTDASSYEISVERIGAHLNKLIIVNAKKDLLGQQNGVNRFTLSESVFFNWLKVFLQAQTVTNTQDNLILSFENITIKTVQDGLYATYSYEPNYPVNKLFVTGVMLDKNSLFN